MSPVENQWGYLVVMLLVGCDFALESFLMNAWNRWYFGRGFSLLKCDYLHSGEASRPDVEDLRMKFGDCQRLPFKFHKWDEGGYAFLPGAGRGVRTTALTAVPFMRGHVAVDKLTSRVSVRGRLNWFAVVFPVGFYYVFISLASQREGGLSDFGELIWLLVVCNVVFMSVSYIAQYRRFQKIAKYLEAADPVTHIDGSDVRLH